MSQHLTKQSDRQEPSDQEEISLIEIIVFLKKTYKTILLSGVIGLVIASLYSMFAPKRYEASAQIAMAQISAATTNTNNNNLNPLGVNIEEPALLISRLSAPTSFTPQTIAACGLQDQANAGDLLVKSLKLTPLKAVPNVVELKTSGASPQAALACANAIFDLIKTSQAQIVAPYIEEAQIKLTHDQKRLASAQQVVANADKSGQAMSASYLSTRDEIRYLLDEITSLKNVVNSNEARATRLVAPIYASDTPVWPKKRVTVLAGLFGGLILGLILALARQMMTNLKSQMQAVS